MLKTISAALLAVSVLAVPALAAGPAKTTQAPTVKSEQAKSAPVKSEQVKTKTTEQAKTGVLNANAKMGRHHHKHQVLEGLEGLDQARRACRHQARLKLIRGRGLTTLPPATPCG